MSSTEARDLLRTYRENNTRNSTKVVVLWQDVMKDNVHSLGSEKFAVIEQAYIAALDTQRMDIANECYKALSHEFPGSLRVKKLGAMQLEAVEKYEEAMDLLDSIIKVDKANSACRKRKVAIYKAQGRIPAAIKELTDYLKIFAADAEGWQELSELYISECDWQKAAFCLEELILHNPHNHLLYQRYAEIKYTQGGAENFESAMKYYYLAVKLCPKNLRACYGLYLCAINLGALTKSSAEKKSTYAAIAKHAMTKVQSIYANKQADVTALNECFSALQM